MHIVTQQLTAYRKLPLIDLLVTFTETSYLKEASRQLGTQRPFFHSWLTRT